MVLQLRPVQRMYDANVSWGLFRQLSPLSEDDQKLVDFLEEECVVILKL